MILSRIPIVLVAEFNEAKDIEKYSVFVSGLPLYRGTDVAHALFFYTSAWWIFEVQTSNFSIEDEEQLPQVGRDRSTPVQVKKQITLTLYFLSQTILGMMTATPPDASPKENTSITNLG